MTFDEWLRISDEQRREVVAKWNSYGGEGDEIVAASAELFRTQLGPNGDVEVRHGVYHGGEWIIGVTVPFVFDKRRIPDSFLSITVRRFTKDLPPEFQVRDAGAEYVWAPERYELFVDRAAEEVRTKLGQPTMDRHEMLNALCGEDFDEFTARCRQWEKEGKIPSYRGHGS